MSDDGVIRLVRVAGYLFVALVFYVVIAEVVFAFRHPWMTDTERFLNTPAALTFATVKQEDIRK